MERILIFRTLPDHLNTNKNIARYVASSVRRVIPHSEIIEASISSAAGLVETLRPTLLIGIGSVAIGSVSFEAIAVAARKIASPVVYWLHDDPYEIDYAWRLRGLADWIFTNDRTSVYHYGIDTVSHLPLAASLDDHFRPIVPIAERPINVFFCGYAYPNRAMTIYRLRHALRQMSARICGDGWDPSLDFCENKRLSATDIVDYYGLSKITLNIGRVFNIGNGRYEVVASTPGPRTFEAAAAGALQCYFVDSTEMFDYYVPNTEMLIFNDEREFSVIVDGLWAHPEKYTGIAAAAQERTRHEHTYDHRVRTLFSVLAGNNIVDQTFNASAGAATEELNA